MRKCGSVMPKSFKIGKVLCIWGNCLNRNNYMFEVSEPFMLTSFFITFCRIRQVTLNRFQLSFMSIFCVVFNKKMRFS